MDAVSFSHVFMFQYLFSSLSLQDHVPGFLKSVQAIKSKGVDTIACVSVNDPFVMSAWGKALDPDGKVKSFLFVC